LRLKKGLNLLLEGCFCGQKWPSKQTRLNDNEIIRTFVSTVIFLKWVCGQKRAKISLRGVFLAAKTDNDKERREIVPSIWLGEN
jgi:hypothetical protein